MRKVFFLILSILSFCPFLQAQLEVKNVGSDNTTPEEMISRSLIGEGVEILSIEYFGSEDGLGRFNNGNDIIGEVGGNSMDQGLVMTTGFTESITRPVEVLLSDAINLPPNRDPDILKLSDTSAVDYAMIVIKFIPETDTLKFNYIFGSEEYPEYVCSEFNDIFGFIISGPGINGDYANGGKNIALIPGTDLPVAINSINSGVSGVPGSSDKCQSLAYADLFIDNEARGSNAQPVFDGMTKVFEARSVVQPCEEYTIKLIVCDVRDGLYDSGMFLEAGSFSTNPLKVDITSVAGDDVMMEGCSETRLEFTSSQTRSTPLNLDLEVIGEAQFRTDFTIQANGTEVTDLSTVEIGNQEKLTLVLSGVEDQIDEGSETISLVFRKTQCATKDTIKLLLKDRILQDVNLPDNKNLCGQAEIELDGTNPTVVPEDADFESNNTVEISPEYTIVQSDIVVSGVESFTVSPVSTPVVCLDIEHPNPAELDIYLVSPGGQRLELMTSIGQQFVADFQNTCFSSSATVSIKDGAPPYSGTFLPEGDFSELYGSEINGIWSLIATDKFPSVEGRIKGWSIAFENIYEIKYKWSPNQNISSTTAPIVQVNPAESTKYFLEVSDIYGCKSLDSVTINIFEEHEFSIDSTRNTCYGGSDASLTISSPDNTLTYTWDNNVTGANNTGLKAGTYCVTMEGGSGCKQQECFTLTDPDSIRIEDEITNVGCSVVNEGSITINASGGTGPLTIQWNELNSGDFTISDLAPGTYTATIRDGNDCEKYYEGIVSNPTTFSIQETVNDVSCAGQNDGSIQLFISGNNKPVSVEWTGPNGFTSNTNEINDLEPGEYEMIAMEEDGCTVQEKYAVNQPSVIELNYSKTDIKCYGSNTGIITMTASGGVTPYDFSIDNGNSFTAQSTFNNLNAGTYGIVVKDANGCLSSLDPEQVMIEEPAATIINLENQHRIRFGETVTLSARVSIPMDSIASIVWTPLENLSCGDCLETIASPTFSTNYLLTITDKNNCQTTARVFVEVDRSFKIFVPNAFSPNNDGVNDYCTIFSEPGFVKEIKSFQVYNRWGSLVHSVKNQLPDSKLIRWDGMFNGKESNEGMYTWVAKVMFVGDIENTYTGNITIIK